MVERAQASVCATLTWLWLLLQLIRAPSLGELSPSALWLSAALASTTAARCSFQCVA